jgi:citrate lyase subunit beta/citryl-CoA lyase
VHPRQIETVRNAFAPSEEAVQAAAAMLAEFEARQRDQVGVYVDGDGKMVDAAVVRAAQLVLDRAQRRK